MNQQEIKTVSIESLIENPDNPNRMSKSSFSKLLRNIELTGKYEPIIVRLLPVTRDSHHNSNLLSDEKRATSYEIINGYHRFKALKELGYKDIDIIVWDVNDKQAQILLASLNRLRGSDVLDKKLSLINKLNENNNAKELAKILPYSSGQIERFSNMNLPKAPAKQDRNKFKEPIVFFVNPKQKKIIEKSIKKIQNESDKTNSYKTKSDAITKIAESFIKKINNVIARKPKVDAAIFNKNMIDK